jgi:hypothetical protein
MITMNATSMLFIKGVTVILVAAFSLNGYLCGTHNYVPFLRPYFLWALQRAFLLWATVN